jgi:hypothetical protein
MIAALLFATVGSVFFPDATKPRADGTAVEQKYSATARSIVTPTRHGRIHIQQLPDDSKHDTKSSVRTRRRLVSNRAGGVADTRLAQIQQRRP